MVELMIRLALLAALLATIRPVQGPVILARGGTEALYLWDATPYVTQLVAKKNVGTSGLHALEATAVSALEARARTSQAKTLRMKVLYSRVGAVSKVYGNATFAGVEDVVHLKASRIDLIRNGTQWAQAIAQEKSVRGLSVEVTGKLPPPN